MSKNISSLSGRPTIYLMQLTTGNRMRLLASANASLWGFLCRLGLALSSCSTRLVSRLRRKWGPLSLIRQTTTSHKCDSMFLFFLISYTKNFFSVFPFMLMFVNSIVAVCCLNLLCLWFLLILEAILSLDKSGLFRLHKENLMFSFV